MDALVAVRARIARAIVGTELTYDARLGDIVLQPHQVDAVRRLRSALREFGGALLADAPGLGKTYVALAIARDAGGACVASPAALRPQWLRSAARAGLDIEFVSLETLSRRAVSSHAPLVIVDEAHHLRNPHTRRYAHVAALAVGRPVLLLSATPVHNRASDRDALLALFLGASSSGIASSTLARLIVRRGADPKLLPRRARMRWLSPPRAPDIAPLLAALPPPLPAADGADAAALVRLSLAHAWSSSVAALDDAARRSIQRAAALDDALAAGRWPTRAELRAWLTTAESSQLAFPELMAAATTANLTAARAMLTRHVGALRTLRERIADALRTDADARADALRRVLASHPGATTIAFSRYAGTIDALWRALRLEPGVVAITARGVRSAGGGLRRRDLLAALAAPDAACDARAPLRLVLSTDMLGEGRDVRAASVIVHFDQPWTAARLEQREGRATRLGSPHAMIAVYAVRAPRGAERLLRMSSRLRIKRAAGDAGVAAGAAREQLLALVRPWLQVTPGRPTIAAGLTDTRGWIAVLRDALGAVRVVAAVGGGPATDDDAIVLDLLRRAAHATEHEVSDSRMRSARLAIARWIRHGRSSQSANARDAAASHRSHIVRRLDAALRTAPLHHRVSLRSRIDATRSRLSQLSGAGAERALAAAARDERLADMLNAIDRIAVRPPGIQPPVRSARVMALLLLDDG